MLLLKNLLFSVVVPGIVAVYVPLLLVRGYSLASGVVVVVGLAAVLIGSGMYACALVISFAEPTSRRPRTPARRFHRAGDARSRDTRRCSDSSRT